MKNNKTTKGNKRPIKKLIALWVVFAMLVVPFASYVGDKEGAKAEGDAEKKGTVIETPQSVQIDIPITVEYDDSASDIKCNTNSGQSVTLLADAQKIEFKLSDSTNNSILVGEQDKSVTYKYKKYDVTVSPDPILSDSGLTLIDSTTYIDGESTNKKYAVYAKLDTSSSYILQYVLNVTYVQYAFTEADGFFDETDTKLGNGVYTNSAYLEAGDSSTTFTHGEMKYYVKEGTAPEEAEYKQASNYTFNPSTILNTVNYKDKDVYAYAALVMSDSTILAYKSLGNVHISSDGTPPQITDSEVKYELLYLAQCQP